MSRDPRPRAAQLAARRRRCAVAALLPCWRPAALMWTRAGNGSAQIDAADSGAGRLRTGRAGAAARSGGRCRPAAPRAGAGPGAGAAVRGRPARPDAGWLVASACRRTASSAGARKQVYRHALEHMLLPRLILRLEAQMRGRMQPARLPVRGDAGLPDARRRRAARPRTRARRGCISTGRRPIRARLRAAARRRWNSTSPRCSTSRCRRCAGWRAGGKARAHLQPRDAGAAGLFAHPARRPRRTALPPWRPRDALGAAGVGVFVRRSGKPMTDGIPGLLHRRRVPQGAAAATADAAKQVASESWVLGKRSKSIPTARRCATCSTT